MWDGVSVKTKPTTRAVDLVTVKKWLRVDHSDDDDIITLLIDAAIALIDGPSGIGIALFSQTWQKSLDCFGRSIRLPGWPVTEIAAVTYVDVNGTTQTISPADYTLDIGAEPATLCPVYGGSWPVPRAIKGAVKVDYLVGRDDVADIEKSLIMAVCMLVSYRYERREAASADAITETPLGVQMILDDYRRSYVAA